MLVLWLLESSAPLYSISWWCRGFVVVVAFGLGYLMFTYSLFLSCLHFTSSGLLTAFFMKLASAEGLASASKFSAEVKVSSHFSVFSDFQYSSFLFCSVLFCCCCCCCCWLCWWLWWWWCVWVCVRVHTHMHTTFTLSHTLHFTVPSHRYWMRKQCTFGCRPLTHGSKHNCVVSFLGELYFWLETSWG